MRFISASRTFSGNRFLDDSTILVLSDQGTIADFLPEDGVEPGRVERLQGILTPGFINAHCHLELSHMKGMIPRHTGIVDFGLSVIRQRHSISEEEQLDRMHQANLAMKAAGIVAVGDISNSPLSIRVKQGAGLYYHTFVELIALNPQRAAQVFDTGRQVLDQFREAGLAASLAPHAPYSCSSELIGLITTLCHHQRQPTSIHNQESRAENEFFLQKTGDYLRLYETLGFPPDFFSATGKSSLRSLIDAFQPQTKTLLVHNTFSESADIDVALKHLQDRVYWCLCPNANLYIEQSLPDVPLLLSKGCQLTLGTDSLASNSSLSVLDEILALNGKFPQVPFETWLRAATLQGAEFLGIGDCFGSLEKGKAPGLNLIEPDKGTVLKLA